MNKRVFRQCDIIAHHPPPKDMEVATWIDFVYYYCHDYTSTTTQELENRLKTLEPRAKQWLNERESRRVKPKAFKNFPVGMWLDFLNTCVGDYTHMTTEQLLNRLRDLQDTAKQWLINREFQRQKGIHNAYV